MKSIQLYNLGYNLNRIIKLVSLFRKATIQGERIAETNLSKKEEKRKKKADTHFRTIILLINPNIGLSTRTIFYESIPISNRGQKGRIKAKGMKLCLHNFLTKRKSVLYCPEWII